VFLPASEASPSQRSYGSGLGIPLRTPSPAPSSLRASPASSSAAASLAAASAAALQPLRASPALVASPALRRAPPPSFGLAARAVATGLPRRASDGASLSPAAIAPVRLGAISPTEELRRERYERERAEKECTRLRSLLAAQATALASAEAALAERDADCAQLGTLLAAVHRGELAPAALRDFAGAEPAPARAPTRSALRTASPPPAPRVSSSRPAAPPTRGAFHGASAEEVSWESPLSSRPAVERPPSVPPLPLFALRRDGVAPMPQHSPPLPGVRGTGIAGRGWLSSGSNDSASAAQGMRPASRLAMR